MHTTCGPGDFDDVLGLSGLAWPGRPSSSTQVASTSQHGQSFDTADRQDGGLSLNVFGDELLYPFEDPMAESFSSESGGPAYSIICSGDAEKF
ncbi:uncharacterized protein PHACADRAFT_250546 [Phanerochaete carnosa HHB-10118-sp]|uniref:Uncharacterized protein n=1 Tax=Phanerochaete carnosa (strain HHB-10118-sp) TaxID=650164 RepID=K5WKA9_PHACS|nr:uncharacterized protein PHACADRAFT_250546 [Phanerochaete carnosa HHB-10118-sp]EKM59810.1 hypothetical protein PHACADRAFT_250546 [Phanerochaete carnosa HHB-10118-sp]